MTPLMTAGAIIALLGLAGVAIPYFSTQQTHEVAHIGDLKVNATETTSHSIPPLLAGGAVVLGVVLMGAGLTRRS